MSYRKKHIHPKIRGLRKRKRFFQMPLFWILLLVFVMVVAVVYLIFFFPKFQITNIEISGNEKIKTEDIQNLAWTDIHKNIITKNIFMADTKNITKDISNAFPEIETVLVQKKWPQGILLTIKERKPFAVFCDNETPGKCFFIDENGVIFEPLENSDQNMVIVHKEAAQVPKPGKNIISKNIAEVISKVQKNLKDNFQVDVQEVRVSNLLIFKTSENWQIYFDLKQDIDLEITKMNLLLKNEIPAAARKKLQYIYLQYQNRAYYK